MNKTSSYLALAAFFSLACSSSSPSPGAPQDASTAGDASAPDATSDASTPWAPDATSPDAAAIVGARPYTLHVPPGYDATKPTPLVVMFHGYGFSGSFEETYMAISDASDKNTFLYAYGDGTIDQVGKRFWNATDGCCNLYGSNVDDVAYFNAIVDDVNAKYHVDPKRIFALGHSNGGFMAHRLACDAAPRIAAIVSLAGVVWNDATKCQPASRVSVLGVHGDADQTIPYAGGASKTGAYPSEHASLATWAQKNGCTGALGATGQMLDIDSNLTGAETKVETYGACPAGIDVQLWTIQGGGHIPTLNNPAWGDLVWGFFAAHPKP